MKFEDLNLIDPIMKSINDMGYEAPTNIQEKAIPILLDAHSDFVGMAQTGSGKTAAFVIPLLQKLKPNGKIQAIVLTPSRELAKQVENEVAQLGKYLKIKSTPIYGGVSYDKQIGIIKKDKPEIIVGTPGRVIDLINQKILNFSNVNTCVLDEADEMLRMGFFDDVQLVLSHLNKEKRIWMFSATMPNEISSLIDREFQNPKTVKAKKEAFKGENITQRYYLVDRRRRDEALHRILQTEIDNYTIIFCRTRQETRELSDKLIERGLKVESLSGDMGQNLRESALRKFKARKINILVCTDVAARGIDVKDVTHVFNYGLPQDNETYVHRIGRTGRAGKKGIAITLIPPSDQRILEKMAYLTNSSLTKCELPSTEVVKKKIIEQNLERMNKIVDAVVEKGSDYHVDPSFKVYSKFFSDLDKESLEKVMFTYMFNKELRHIDELGDISPKRGGDSQRSSSRRQADRGRKFYDKKKSSNRSGGRRSEGGGRRSEGGGRRKRAR